MVRGGLGARVERFEEGCEVVDAASVEEEADDVRGLDEPEKGWCGRMERVGGGGWVRERVDAEKSRREQLPIAT